MEIKKITNNILSFIIKRFIEIFGFCVSLLGLALLASLLTYSPEDPNFIFSENTEIKNILGYRGSFVSDFFFQSIGLISIIFAIGLFFNGIIILLSKKVFIFVENLFYSILYSITGSLFFSTYYQNSFWLSVNGNGGFVGNFLENTFFTSIINLNKNISYYILIIIIIILFLISINFKPKLFFNLLKTIIKFPFKKKDENLIIKENDYDSENFDNKNENLVQENLPFVKKQTDTKNIKSKFVLPSIDLLKAPLKKERKKINEKNNIDSDFLEKILLDFGVEGKIKKVSHGPVVTLNEFEPAAGIKVSKIINLSDDIARNTSSESARISTIPGRSTIGIELPNSSRENVFLSEIISHGDFSNKEIKLPIALGKSISGVPITGDLDSMPHLLIAGTTGSGKSVCINTIILSLLYRHGPDKCKFILIDPKMLELSTYEGIPHLLCPVITEAKKAASVLGWVVKEMESRYRLMTREGVKNINGYNEKHKLAMPYIVVIVDEMSDLMLVAGKEIENYIQKLSQMARAAGIHIIMATQRPSVDVITGTIKANFPTRISFQVTSKIDSRTILGEQGAEQLLGKGDMLYMSSANKIVRIHAPFVSENEIEKINNFLRSQAEPDYVDEILNFADEKESSESISGGNDKDELYQAALDIIKSERKASTSLLQRKLQIGYNRAARIIDMMELEGVVSKANHVGKRDVLK
tara:strand:+ start:848 stop:2941 length:2094 start_codon:yes stop_codon:yes gene_type:complete